MAQNPGICETVYNYYQDDLKVLPEVNFRLKFAQDAHSDHPPIFRDSNNLKKFSDEKANELSTLANLRQLKSLKTRHEDTVNMDYKDLTIMRYLDSNDQMSISGHWILQKVQEKNSCWLCDNWIFSLFFWSKKIGHINDRAVSYDIDTKKKAH